MLSHITSNMAQRFKLMEVEHSLDHRGSVFNLIESEHRKSVNYPPILPILAQPFAKDILANVCHSILATNGPVPIALPRASPAPQGPLVPNGKPTAPYSDRSNNPVSPSAQIAAQTVSSKDPKAAAQAASDMRNVVRRKLNQYVGFANLPNQWHRKSVRKGFNFNVMVVGMWPLVPGYIV